MATSDESMDIDGPSYELPAIPYFSPSAATTLSQQSPPASSARKRSHDEYAADYIQPPQGPQFSKITIYSSPDEPKRYFEGKFFNIIYNIIDIFFLILTKTYHQRVTTIETGENGSNKRRAVITDINIGAARATPASKSKLPGAFPVTPDSQKAEPIQPIQQATARHDSPMEEGPIVQSPAQETSPLSQRKWKSNNQETSSQLNTATTEAVPQHSTKSNNATSTQHTATTHETHHQKSKGNNDTSPQSNITTSHELDPKHSPTAFLTEHEKKIADQNKVTRVLPRPSLADKKWSPLLARKTSNNRDKEIDQLIFKTKNAVLRDRQPEFTLPASLRASRAQKKSLWSTTNDLGATLQKTQQANAAAKRAAEQKAKHEAEKAKLKASADAIELQLQEEAAKQAAKIEEEKQAEALRKELEQKAKLSDPEYIKKQQIIRPLDPEWDDKVDDAMKTRARNHVIAKTVEGTELTRHDFGTLLPQHGTEDNSNGWLNDEIVNGWMAAIVDRKSAQAGYVRSAKSVPPFAAMSSGWYTNYKQGGIKKIERWSQRKGIKGEKLLKCEKIFFPINTGAHWSLLIISPKDRKIEVLDSLGNSPKHWFRIAREWLEMELKDKYHAGDWTEATSRSQFQLNSNDCGVFTCFNALASAKGVGFEQVQGDEMDDARRMMGAIFIHGGFHDDYEL